MVSIDHAADLCGLLARKPDAKAVVGDKAAEAGRRVLG